MTHQKNKIFLLGGDLSTSQSYIMQNTIYRQFGLPFEYCMCSLDAKSKLATFLKKNNKSDFFAANVTFPYKHEVLKLVDFDEVDNCAQFCEGTNLILGNGRRMVACNFDGPGLGVFLNNSKIQLRNKNVMIFGTGITARSIAYALNSFGVAQIIFVSRSKKKAKEILLHYESKFSAYDVDFKTTTYDKINNDVASADLVINATPMGKFADIIDANPMEGYDFSPGQIAIDVVYTHGLTPFLSQAKNADCQIYDGTYMLAAQAAMSVEKIVDYFGM